MALSLCGKRLLPIKTICLRPFRQAGYVVLLPEIAEDLQHKSSLLSDDGLPEFNNLTIESCTVAIANQSLRFEEHVKNVENNLQKAKEDKKEVDIFKEVFHPLEDIGVSLELTWGLAKTLYLGNNTLMPTNTYLQIHNRARRARGSKYNSNFIFNAVKNDLNSKSEKTTEQERLLKKFAIEGKLNGLDLANNQQALLRDLLKKITEEKTIFKQKIDSQTLKFAHVINDPKVVENLPKSLLEATSLNASDCNAGPWKVTLQPNIYLPVMQRCPDRDIRWNLWQALANRGSGYLDNNLTTVNHLEEVRYSRHHLAKLLGYKTFADMSIETKMAQSVEQIHGVLETLLKEAKPAQDNELLELLKFASDRGFQGDSLQLWDVPYWRKQQEIEEFQHDDLALIDYFPLKNVLEGMFALTEKLYNIQILERKQVSVWHKDVKFYDIFEPNESAPVGGFYIDPYARNDEKLKTTYNNGWVVTIQNKSKFSNRRPLSSLIFNFEPPTKDRPCCLSFKEVDSLFHKFGHSLQHLLTKTTYYDVAGLSNIEWDAVEVCGHFMSFWLSNPHVLSSISSHYATNEKLPENMIQSLIKTQTHLTGLDLSKELYLSALDLKLYSSRDYWLNIVKELWPHYRSFPLDKLDSHPCSFTQIVSEEWGAAYYSHVWSKIIAADVFSAFKDAQNSEQLPQIGNRFKETYLASGGALDATETFRRFRGRDPSPKALLRHLGLETLKNIK